MYGNSDLLASTGSNYAPLKNPKKRGRLVKYREFNSNFHPARVRDQVIILDIAENKFHILSKDESTKLITFYTSEKNVIFNGQKLLLEKFHDNDLYQLLETKETMGVNVNFWNLKRSDISFNNIMQILTLIKSLHRSHTRLKKGLPYTIKKLKKNSANIEKKELDIPILVKHLNTASLIYPLKTKCLEWSVALFDYITKRGYLPTLKIGVQNRPFYSHAWLEIDGEIIGDIQDLNDRMIVIYQISMDVKE